MTDEIPEHLKGVFAELPDTLEREEVEALLMTISQTYAPSLGAAINTLLRSAMVLKDIQDVLEEAKTATKQ